MRVALALCLVTAVAGGGCLDGLFSADVSPRDYLRDLDYTLWIIEVDYAEGERPPDSALSLLRDRMQSVVRKPDGVEVRMDEVLEREETTWGTDSLRQLRRDHQDEETDGHTVVTHLSFVAGHSGEDDDEGRVLGVAIDHRQVVIFSQTVKSSCTVTSLPPCLYSTEEVFGAVVVHEFGHILGLVNNGIPMVSDHQDESHGAHSDNPDSVMYWAVETTDIFQSLTGELPNQFDADDRADLRAAGGR